MAKRVAGICFVKADSAQLEVQGGVECPASDTNRETVMGSAGPAGYKETARVPYIKLTAIVTPDFPRKTLAESTDMTITAELANGTTYVLSGAYMVGEPAINGEEGTIELQFEGTKGIWQ